jgi:peptidoglycan/LPS O-acetylase OafA/YrhL
MAMDHFFIVSGFLITLILVRTKGLPGYLRVFWARRGLRILPLALACIAAVALIYPESRQQLLGYLFFYANYSHGGETVGALAPMWSLSVEEQFYFVFPVLFWLVPRERLWQLVAVLVMTLAAIRLGFPAYHQYGLYIGSPYTHVRALAIALGSWVALVREGLVPRPRTMAVVFVAWVVTLVVAGGTDDLFTQPFARMGLLDPLGIALGLAILTWCVRRPPRPVAVLRYFGVRCYGAYLLHLPMLMLVQAKAPKLTAHWFLVVWVVVLVAVVELSYRFLETPLLSRAPAYPARAPRDEVCAAPAAAAQQDPA